MEENIVAQRYKELVEALRERDKAEQVLAACERRVKELSGLLPDKTAFKPRKKTPTRNEFVSGCLGRA